MYMNRLLHCHFCIQIITEQGLTPHSHHTRNKCTLIIPYLMPLECILSDTNYYIALYVFLVVSMATNIV